MAMQTYETSQTEGNLTRPIMFAKGDSSDDVFTATSEYWFDTNFPSYGLHEMDWSIEGGAGNDRLTADEEDDTVVVGSATTRSMDCTVPTTSTATKATTNSMAATWVTNWTAAMATTGSAATATPTCAST